MNEDRGPRPSRGEPDPGAVPLGAPRYPEWPSAGHAPDARDRPADVHAPPSDLVLGSQPLGSRSPGDLVPGDQGPAHQPPRNPAPGAAVPEPGHGQPVPRDFVPPQVTWTATPTAPPEFYDGSRVPWDGRPPAYPAPIGRDLWSGSPPAYPAPIDRGPWDGGPAAQAPIERFEQRREDWRPAAAPPVEWVPDTEVFDEPMIDLSAPRPLPVTHRGRRRTRSVVALAAVAAVLAGATGYVLLRGLGLGATTRTDAAVPVVTGTAPGSAPAPADAPADALSIPPSASQRQSTSASPSASAFASRSRTAPATTGASPTAPALPNDPRPPATATPAETLDPHGARPTATATAAALTATLRSERNGAGYAATVTLTNPGVTAVSDWTVRITVPGVTRVAVVGSGVSAVRNGDDLTFTPTSGAAPIAAGGSLTYAFAVTGSLSSPPSGCSINGAPCS